MSRTERFVDTGFWLAITNTRDDLYERASHLMDTLDSPLVTTEAVLVEVGNSLSKLPWRGLAADLIADVLADPDIEVVPLTPALLERALQLYRERPDKEWGLTDCISFIVMGDRGIHEALAADQHFTQAGFQTLLRPN